MGSRATTPSARQDVDGSVGHRGTALIVDDEATNRLLLGTMLRREGFHVIEAEDGYQALSLFDASSPDIIFMDVMMPGMDGFETTRRIKARSGADFVPVIFLTALHDDHSQVRCIEVGGDDSLSKPFSFTILKARIVAMERVRDLHRSIAAKNRMLAGLLEIDRQEQALAERIFSYAVNDRNVAREHLGLLLRPAATFNGDLFLSQYLPDGSLRVLLGDFTGHGLAAAIGALPVSDAFHSMTRKGVVDEMVLEEINSKLYRVLPADRFMCACMVTLPASGDVMRWWNGGMPDAMLCHADGIRRLSSHSLPLGIMPELTERDVPREAPLKRGDRVLLMTDGLLEVRDTQGRSFGETGLKSLIESWRHGSSLMTALEPALDAHCKETQPQDDIGVVEIPFVPRLFGRMSASTVQYPSHTGECSCSIVLRDERLGSIPSVESLLASLGLLEELWEHVGSLETILHELYANALEHGVLKLPSWMKTTPDGFSSYYTERENRLAAVPVGSIRVDLHYEPDSPASKVRITITDSGQGFDIDRPCEPLHVSVRPWGRGIALVRELCESVNYYNQGTQVEAVYRCA
ncbi:serine/threonine protein phosphatase [Ectothiorhodospira shaposhnikovii]|uniref:ATP-binding SpoIIE family protein phosphatase n=1 Tax=Ectothiorhodospira shaposhnikovii TaxID=1054 RepID=UPI0019090367|nr:fused response regulator/phosphatase [Ectothiorhodospira shaposhnikovii]MBK1673028.1 serine/threonine protein phosphatase [Ectothiorhodospira shaposhnikovii]